MDFIQQFNYNRDGLTEGSIVGFTGAPIYGSSIAFTATNSSWRGSNYYQFTMANGLNSIKAEMDFTFQGNKENIKSILRRIENVTTGDITGDIAFSGTENCINFGESKNNVQINLDTGYYQNFSGSQVSNYNIKHISSDVYELNVSMFNNRVSSVLNNGMGFVADRTTAGLEAGGIIAVDPGTYVLNGATGDGFNSNVFDNYFYTSGVNADLEGYTITRLTGLSTYTGFVDPDFSLPGPSLTRVFFWEPDQQISVPVDHSARTNELKNSFHQQLNISRNQNRIDQLRLRFTNRNEKDTYQILHFLETHLGHKHFVYYYGDDLIQKNKVFYCPAWRHTFNYKDSNTIEATFIEIVAPVTPEF